jgi:L-rhamnose-H+ transport protein
LVAGFLFVLLAGLLQGTFVLPMTMVRRWSWENTWATFSFLGMFVFNWIIAICLIPNIATVYAATPSRDLGILMLFGAGWGVGAILFGLGMARLGMALGYPIIMGLIASLGALIPLLIFFPKSILTSKGILLVAGTALVVAGIVLCSIAGSRRSSSSTMERKGGALRVALTIAIMAGVLSCLPNVGVAFGGSVIQSAEQVGVSSGVSGNAIWALLFTLGCVVNVGYCAYLMITKKTYAAYWCPEFVRNLGLSAWMAAMWIGSFYLYGAGASRLGRWGVVVGWPLFISLSIVTGNLWGLSKGEWLGASPRARRMLNTGLGVLIAAVVAIALSNSL